MKLKWCLLVGVAMISCFKCIDALASPEYQFQRFSPILQQPWYFGALYDIDIGANGYVYAASGNDRRIFELTLDGRVVNIIRQPDQAEDGAIAVGAANNIVLSGATSLAVIDRSGALLAKWSFQSSVRNNRNGVAVDAQGRIHAIVSDDSGQDARIEVYESDGTFIRSFGGEVLSKPRDLTIGPAGEVFVADWGVSRVLKFSEDGQSSENFFPSEVDVPIGEETQAHAPFGIVYDSVSESLLVVHWFADLVSRVDMTGALVGTLGPGSAGYFGGFYAGLNGVAVDALGRTHVVQRNTRTVGRFDLNSSPLERWGGVSLAGKGLVEPVAIATTVGENYFVSSRREDPFFYRGVLKYSLRGEELLRCDSYVLDGTQRSFDFVLDLGSDASGNVYVVDPDNEGFPQGVEIIKLDPDCNVLDRFSQLDPQLVFPDNFISLAVRPDGGFAIAKSYVGGFVKYFDSDGNVLAKTGDGEFTDGEGIVDVDYGDQDLLFMLVQTETGELVVEVYDESSVRQRLFTVADCPRTGQSKIIAWGSQVAVSCGAGVQVFDPAGNLLHSIGSLGFGPGQFSGDPPSMAEGDDGRIIISDFVLGRTSVFVLAEAPEAVRAIVLAGGGPYPGNALWAPTQVNANFAYRSLAYQGFSKETIHYLSADTRLDLDQNGLADDVDADATSAHLREAILGPNGDASSGFAATAENLVLYLVDHGGFLTFRMSGTETLSAAELDAWLDTWQAAHPDGRVTLIYDACQSGSFLSVLAGPRRTIITSAMDDQSAFFVSQAGLSFSNFFWTHVFNGLDIKSAFELAAESTTLSFGGEQSPLIDADGDGVPNTLVDLATVDRVVLGNGTDSFSSRPVIGSVTGAQMLATGNTATITASDVSDPDGISRVWVVLRPPGFNPGSPDHPVSDLPTFDLQPQNPEKTSWSLVHGGFSEPGTYQLTISALDGIGNISIPKQTAVTVQNPLKRRAVVAVGQGATSARDAAFEQAATVAVKALKQQGYGPDGTNCLDSACDQVQFLIDAGLGDADGTPAKDNLDFAITQWGTDGVQDLTVHLIGEREGDGIRLHGSETLSQSELEDWIIQAEATIPGRLTLIVDADGAADVVYPIAPNARRIAIASSAPGEVARFLLSGQLSFTQFFWSQVLNGATVEQAFLQAGAGVGFGDNPQVPQLDDNANGAPNEPADGVRSRTYAIGTGVLLAGDEPLVDRLVVADPLEADFEPIRVGSVTTTGEVAQVVAIVTQPDGQVVVERLIAANDGSYLAAGYGLCAGAGIHDVAVFAVDVTGATSVPLTAQASRASGCARQGVLFVSGFE